MHVSELVDVAVAGIDHDRVKVVSLQPVGVADEAATGLAWIVSELVSNATAFSDRSDKVQVSGAFNSDGYLISILDRGVGMSQHFLDGLNRLLESHDTAGQSGSSGIHLVAGLAARHGIDIRMVHGEPGVTAEVSIPEALLEEEQRATPPFPSEGAADSVPMDEHPPDIEGFEHSDPNEAARRETEAFLASVFAPLWGANVTRDLEVNTHPAQDTEEVTPAPDVAVEPSAGLQASELNSRVPGQNYLESVGDFTYTREGEAAVQIKLALSEFERGRQEAHVDPFAESVDDP